MLDRYWHGDVERVSPEAPVPVVHIQREEYRLGGAANVALNIKTLGGRVTLLSVVGRDDAAHRLRELLDSQGIDHDFSEDAGMQTVVKLRVIARNQQIVRIDFEKNPRREKLSILLQRFLQLVKDHDVVLLSDYGKGCLLDVQDIIKLARQEGKVVLVDPKGKDWSRYSGACVITPNRRELAEVIGSWTSEGELHARAEELRQKLKIDAILLTRSEEGVSLFDAGQVWSVPARACDIADVTGAGDTLIAILTLMVTCGLDLLDAVEWANRGGGLVVSMFGTASLTYEELCEWT